MNTIQIKTKKASTQLKQSLKTPKHQSDRGKNYWKGVFV